MSNATGARSCPAPIPAAHTPLRDHCLAFIDERGAASANDIGTWLRGHGIEKYKPSAIQARLNGLRKLGLAKLVGHGPGGLDARQWELATASERPLGSAREPGGAPGGELRLELVNGSIDVRIYRPHEISGTMTPTKDGLRLNVQCLPALIAELQAAEASAREMGWIGGGA